MTAPASSDSDGKRTAMLATFRQRWRLTLITMLIFALAGMVFCLSVAPVYVATAQLMLPSPQAAADAPTDADAPTPSYVDDQIALLKSNKLMARVVANENLDQVPEFAPPRPSLMSRLMTSLWGSRDEPAAPDSTDGIDPKFAPAIGRLQEMVQVRRVAQSNTLAVEAASHDRGRAARIANALVAAYLDVSRPASTSDAKAPEPAPLPKPPQLDDAWREAWRERLRQEIDRGQNDIRRAQEALAHELKHYASRPEPGPARSAPNTGTREDRARAAKLAADEARKRLDDVRRIAEDNGDPGTLGDALPAAAKLARDYTNAKHDEAELSERLGPRHPDLREARRERVKLAARLRKEAQDALPQLERAATSATTKAETGSKETKGQSAHASAAPAVLPPPPPPVPLPTARSDADRAQSALQHLRDVTDTVLNNLRQKIGSLPVPSAGAPAPEQRQDLTPAAQVISPALPPLKPSFPNPALVLEFALATGLVLGLLLSALNENIARASATPRKTGQT